MDLMEKKNDFLKRYILNKLRNHNSFEKEEDAKRKNTLAILLKRMEVAYKEQKIQSLRKLLGNKELCN